MDASHPVVQAVIAPFAVALVAAGISRLAGGRGWSSLLEGLGVLGSLLVAFLLLRGLPPFPPNAAPEKLFYLIVLAGAVGIAIDVAGRPKLFERFALLMLPAVSLLWLQQRQLLAGAEPKLLLRLVLLGLGGAVVLWQLREAALRNALSGAILTVATAAGAAVVAALAPFVGLALLCGAVIAAMSALAFWSYGAQILGRSPAPFGATVLFAAAGGLVVMVQLLVLFTPSASKPAAALLIIVPFSSLAAERLPLGSGVAARVFGPMLQAAIAVIPVLATFGLARLLPGE